MMYTSTACAEAASSPPAAIRGFVSSMYQSQYTSQMKSYIFCSATPISKASRFWLTSLARVLKRLMTHLSSVRRFSGSPLSSKSSGRFIIMKREAFHSLLAKFLAAFTLSSVKRISFPGALPVASMKRRASAPYSSMTSSGSMPLPSDFDILRPCASRTRPWMSTVLKGTSPVFSRAENIILITQKKMMS